jgi:hypothetical protein
MDITPNRLKTMKSKELRKIIKEAILEVLKESTDVAYTSANKSDTLKKIDTSNLDSTSKASLKKTVATSPKGIVSLPEVEIDEMARIGKGFKLADENFDATPYADKRVSGVSVSDVIEFFRQNPGAEKVQLQQQFNFARPQIANALVNGLLDVGVLVKLGRGGEVELPPAPGEEPAEREEPIRGGEEFLIGPYLDLGTSTPSSSEEETDDEEPIIEPEKIEKITVAGRMSDEDYQAFMKYSELKDRLNATKTNITKTKRSKGIVDIGPDTRDEDILRLNNLKKSLEDRIEALVASSKYLQDKIAKEQTGKISTKPPKIEPVKDEEDEEEISENYEYERRQLQYRAGIIR